MVRHKEYMAWNGDFDLFDKLKELGYVTREYEYFNKKCGMGKVFVGIENKRKFFTVSTHRGKTYSGYYDYDRRSFIHPRYSKIMYELTQKGIDWLLTKIVEENL